jgi:hypothetical protein
VALPPRVRAERNVVYGMVSGLALLMDVYRPAQSNGVAVVGVQGTGWYAPMRYDAPPLKERREVVEHAARFASAGYTVFVINHRSAPRFRFPVPVDDAQRAGALHSARMPPTSASRAIASAPGARRPAATSVEMLGVLDGTGDAADVDPVEPVQRQGPGRRRAVRPERFADDVPRHVRARERSRRSWDSPTRIRTLQGTSRVDDYENRQYRAASPVTHVDASDAPMLLFHGDRDEIVPIQQSELMEATPAEGRRSGHVRARARRPARSRFPVRGRRPTPARRAGLKRIRWFDQYLRRAS